MVVLQVAAAGTVAPSKQPTEVQVAVAAAAVIMVAAVGVKVLMLAVKMLAVVMMTKTELAQPSRSTLQQKPMVGVKVIVAVKMVAAVVVTKMVRPPLPTLPSSSALQPDPSLVRRRRRHDRDPIHSATTAPIWHV